MAVFNFKDFVSACVIVTVDSKHNYYHHYSTYSSHFVFTIDCDYGAVEDFTNGIIGKPTYSAIKSSITGTFITGTFDDGRPSFVLRIQWTTDFSPWTSHPRRSVRNHGPESAIS